MWNLTFCMSFFFCGRTDKERQNIIIFVLFIWNDIWNDTCFSIIFQWDRLCAFSMYAFHQILTMAFGDLNWGSIQSLWGIDLRQRRKTFHWHYSDAIMSAIAPQITNPTIVYWTVYSGSDQRKHQSSASLAFVRGIHRWPVNSPNKWPVTRKMFPFDDVIMVMLHVYIYGTICRPVTYGIRIRWYICAAGVPTPNFACLAYHRAR